MTGLVARMIPRRECLLGAAGISASAFLCGCSAFAEPLRRIHVRGGCNFDGSEPIDGQISTFFARRELTTMVERILAASGIEISIVVYETSDRSVPNARACLSGPIRCIIVNQTFADLTGLGSSLTGAAELAGLVAHEIGHHVLGHAANSTLIDAAAELAADRLAGSLLKRAEIADSRAAGSIYRHASVQARGRYPAAAVRRVQFELGALEQSDECRNVVRFVEAEIRRARRDKQYAPSGTASRAQFYGAGKQLLATVGDQRASFLSTFEEKGCREGHALTHFEFYIGFGAVGPDPRQTSYLRLDARFRGLAQFAFVSVDSSALIDMQLSATNIARPEELLFQPAIVLIGLGCNELLRPPESLRF